jgi:hypothetical protein
MRFVVDTPPTGSTMPGSQLTYCEPLGPGETRKVLGGRSPFAGKGAVMPELSALARAVGVTTMIIRSAALVQALVMHLCCFMLYLLIQT